MRTTVWQGANDWTEHVTHELEEGETWEQLGADQPNPVWTHDGWFTRECSLCSRVFRHDLLDPASMKRLRSL